MIVIYPEKFKGNQKFDDDIEVQYRNEKNWNTPITSNGMYSTVVLFVNHKEGEGSLNYELSFKGETLNVVNTNIDCNYQSDNLNYLFDIFQDFEDIL
jgi:hypothetical protein